MAEGKEDVLIFPVAVAQVDTVAQAEKEGHMAIVVEPMVQVAVEVVVII